MNVPMASACSVMKNPFELPISCPSAVNVFSVNTPCAAFLPHDGLWAKEAMSDK
jgi:hypothetical protein